MNTLPIELLGEIITQYAKSVSIVEIWRIREVCSMHHYSNSSVSN